MTPPPGITTTPAATLTYDGHTGTDFRLRDLAAMKKYVAVLAAAPGIVGGARNTEPDISAKRRGKAVLSGKDAGVS